MSGVTAVPTKYRASDGREFTTQEEAETYESMIAARHEFETAQRRYGLALAKTYTTADGKPFDLSRWSFWYVARPHRSRPHMHEVALWPSELRWSWSESSPGPEFWKDATNDRPPVRYRPESLYASEAAARAALVAALDEWIALETEDVEQSKRRILSGRTPW